MKIINQNLLTKRQNEIAMLLLQGKKKSEIADALSISVSTVKSYVEDMYRKCGVHNRAEFIIYVLKHNVIEL